MVRRSPLIWRHVKNGLWEIAPGLLLVAAFVAISVGLFVAALVFAFGSGSAVQVDIP
jgi:hypothetical protein